jgi:hypothetical protein
MIDAERRIERLRLCLEGHRAWMQRHGGHPEFGLASELLQTMEMSLLQCELQRDELMRRCATVRP